MKKSASNAARLFAVVALVAAVLVVIVVASAAMDSGDSGGHHRTPHHAKKKHPRTTAKTYTVESGDTLTAIAHKTGVPVAEILALNPEVDPQILIAGQTLKLR